ncbi:sigma factor G inhibitor Gin [Bacillus suaedaesalsae]|uniref:Sigma factor G inhibitor Gin n=1 Tax=Bacillus suaedaesalsae TaxID=2810349 RepID=A0ABS2DCP7_9BACI|nr:sigma factor G inhibitor Gin [Bacillus suaedaesalsae]
MSAITKREYYGETCVICEKEKEKGIHLYTTFICTDCETEMIHTQTSHPSYQFYIKQLRKITTPKILS